MAVGLCALACEGEPRESLELPPAPVYDDTPVGYEFPEVAPGPEVAWIRTGRLLAFPSRLWTRSDPETSLADLVEYPNSAQVVQMRDGTFELSATYMRSIERLTWGLATRCPLYDMPPPYPIDPTLPADAPGNAVHVETEGEPRWGAWASAILPGTLRDEPLVAVGQARRGLAMCAFLEEDVPEDWVARGHFYPFADASAADGAITGTVEVEHKNDTAFVTVALSGLDPMRTYAAHLHTLPCQSDDGGEGYLVKPGREDLGRRNEVWPAVVPRADGTSLGRAIVGGVLRSDAQSVVVHRLSDGDEPAVACANLTRTRHVPLITEAEMHVTPTGAARPYSSAEAKATMVRQLDGTTRISLDVTGLPPGGTYPAYLGDTLCKLTYFDGPKPYRIDRSITEPDPSNEVWLPLTPRRNMHASAAVVVPAVLRADALSIIISAADDPEQPLFCLSFADEGILAAQTRWGWTLER
ncbi:MAG: hypothetical protein KC620_03980 [Myxococcales bacterium]|nr:hypothetical protein [Myxococcales bacterium]